MENPFLDLFKTIFTAKQPDGKYSAFVQFAGFDSEEEARSFLAKEIKVKKIDIITSENIPTIH